MQTSGKNENGIVVHRKTKTSMMSRKNMQRPMLGMDSVQRMPRQQQMAARSQVMDAKSQQMNGRIQQMDGQMQQMKVAQPQQMSGQIQQMNEQMQVRNSQMQQMMMAQSQIAGSQSKSSGVDMSRVNARMQARSGAQKVTYSKQTAEEMKSEAIAKALLKASRTDSVETKSKKKKAKMKSSFHFGLSRVMLAFGCALAALALIVFIVNKNAPDITLKVAAMQTGIQASYPSYVPRDYNLSDITSESGKIVLNFVNPSSEDKFSLIEESSSWDSNALLTNYVKKEYNENYTLVRENGLTIYMSDGNAAWVNGGVMYKILNNSNSLTKKQIRSIAISL